MAQGDGEGAWLSPLGASTAQAGFRGAGTSPRVSVGKPDLPELGSQHQLRVCFLSDVHQSHAAL